MSDLSKGLFRSIDEVDKLIDTIEQLRAEVTSWRTGNVRYIPSLKQWQHPMPGDDV